MTHIEQLQRLIQDGDHRHLPGTATWAKKMLAKHQGDSRSAFWTGRSTFWAELR